MQSEPTNGTAPPDASALNGNHVLDILVLLARNKITILGATFAAAVVAAIISLLWPHSYTSSTRIMPPQPSQSLTSLLLGQIGGALNPASFALKNPSDMYVSILKGRTVLDAVIARFSLKELYEVDTAVDARLELSRRVSISAARDGIITVEVEDRDARRAANMANAFIEELEKLTLNIAVSDAAQRRLFFERHVRAAKDDLTKAEVALRTFLEESGLAIPEGQSQLTIHAAAQLRAEVTAKEVQLAAMRSFAADRNPDLLRTERELASLKTQLARIASGAKGESGDVLLGLRNVPEAAQTYLQRLRDVKYYEVLFELLAKQFEVAKVEEAKNATVIQVIDRAVPSDKRSWPNRTVIVILSALAACMVSLLWVMLRAKVHAWLQDPVEANKIAALRSNLAGNLRRGPNH